MFSAIATSSNEWLKIFLAIMGVTVARALVDNQPPPSPPPFSGLPMLLPTKEDLVREKQDK